MNLEGLLITPPYSIPVAFATGAAGECNSGGFVGWDNSRLERLDSISHSSTLNDPTDCSF
jgi:hypothetical protein